MPDALELLARELGDTFARACRSTSRLTREVAIAGRPLRLDFAGPAMHDRVMPALEHLAAAHAEPTLTLHVWDAATTGADVALPAGVAADALYHAKDERFELHLDAAGRSALIDWAARSAWAWTSDARALPLHERATPLRKVFQSWSVRHGLQIVHAAAVGTPRGGALIVGRGGSGKSTSAIACLRGPQHREPAELAPPDLLYVGDDYCLVELLADGGAQVHSLYRTGKLNRDMLARLPELQPFVVDVEPVASAPRDEPTRPPKAMLVFDRALAARATSGFPLAAILVPRLDRQGSPDTRVAAAAARDAWRAATPSTVLQLRHDGARTMATLAELVRRAPTFWLELGTELAGVPVAVTALLASLEAGR